MASPWSQLSTDLLLSIFTKLPVVDLIRSAVVCTTWSGTIDEFRSDRLDLRCRQSPWLLFSRGNGGDACFYSVFEQKVYTVRHAAPLLRDDFHHIIGSSHGWLFIVDHCAKLQMFNPVTAACIDLPSYLTSSDQIFRPQGHTSSYFIHKYYHSTGTIGGALHSYNFKHHRWTMYYFTKAILSSDPLQGDYMAVLLHIGGFSFVKAGDKEWTAIASPRKYLDGILYQGQLYMTTNKRLLEVWDVSQPRTTLKQIISIPSQSLENHYYFWYLVETPRGDLLLVQTASNHIYSCYRPRLIDIFKVDIETGSLIQMHDLEEYVIFLGTNSAFCLPSYEYLPPKEKSKLSIYFTDNWIEWMYHRTYTSTKVRAYNWKDGKFYCIIPDFATLKICCLLSA